MDSADRLRQSALQTASSILALQRKVDEEIRALAEALQRRSEELAAANLELQRQTEAARAHARGAEVFRIAFESSGSGMLLVTPDLRIARANCAACEFLGHSVEQLCALGLADITLADDLAATRVGADRLLRGELHALQLETQYRHASGRVVWGSASIALVRDEYGAPLYFVTQVQDITRRKQAEADNRRLELQLLQAQKMEALGTLAGGVAHDFNNILAAIVGNAELLQHLGADAVQLKETAREITGAARRGGELVRQILTFSRRSEQRLSPIRLGPVIHQSLRMLRAALPASIEIRAEIAESGPPSLADATQIQQVVTNLATNAWHAMEVCGGTLSVGLSYVRVDAEAARAAPGLREGLHARLRVSDTGCGMDEPTLAHIFDPFFTTKPPGKGTGLGLSVVYGIVHGHGGAIRVTSAPGRGTTFEVDLPTADELHAAPCPTATTPRRGAGEPVLVVDDEPPVVLVLCKLLRLLGYAARGTSDTDEALALLGREPFALLLVDFNMPVLNGVELAGRAHALRPDLPILMMSGYTPPVDLDDLAALGVREVLEKPVSQALLAERVRLTLDRRRAAP